MVGTEGYLGFSSSGGGGRFYIAVAANLMSLSGVDAFCCDKSNVLRLRAFICSAPKK